MRGPRTAHAIQRQFGLIFLRGICYTNTKQTKAKGETRGKTAAD